MIVCCIIFVIIILVVIVICSRHAKNNTNEIEIENLSTKTFDVEGKETKYTLLENEDGTVYGIEFENPELMEKITTIRRKSNEEIQDLIVDNIYEFTESDTYKIKIETVNGINITTPPFKVVVKENK